MLSLRRYGEREEREGEDVRIHCCDSLQCGSIRLAESTRSKLLQREECSLRTSQKPSQPPGSHPSRRPRPAPFRAVIYWRDETICLVGIGGTNRLLVRACEEACAKVYRNVGSRAG